MFRLPRRDITVVLGYRLTPGAGTNPVQPYQGDGGHAQQDEGDRRPGRRLQGIIRPLIARRLGSGFGMPFIGFRGNTFGDTGPGAEKLLGKSCRRKPAKTRTCFLTLANDEVCGETPIVRQTHALLWAENHQGGVPGVGHHAVVRDNRHQRQGVSDRPPGVRVDQVRVASSVMLEVVVIVPRGGKCCVPEFDGQLNAARSVGRSIPTRHLRPYPVRPRVRISPPSSIR